MHPRVLAERTESARARILGAARDLARIFSLEAPADALHAAGHRDAGVFQMQELEAVAALLEGVVQAAEQGGDPDAELPLADYDRLTAAEIREQAEGLSPEDREVLRAYEVAHKNRATVVKALERAQAPDQPEDPQE